MSALEWYKHRSYPAAVRNSISYCEPPPSPRAGGKGCYTVTWSFSTIVGAYSPHTLFKLRCKFVCCNRTRTAVSLLLQFWDAPFAEQRLPGIKCTAKPRTNPRIKTKRRNLYLSLSLSVSLTHKHTHSEKWSHLVPFLTPTKVS